MGMQPAMRFRGTLSTGDDGADIYRSPETAQTNCCAPIPRAPERTRILASPVLVTRNTMHKRSLVLLLGLLGAAGCASDAREAAFEGKPRVGSIVQVVGPEGAPNFVMARSPQAAFDVYLVEKEGSLADRMRLNSADRSVGYINRGARGKVLDQSRLSLTDSSYFFSLQLEIQDGPRQGTVGWVPLDFVAADTVTGAP